MIKKVSHKDDRIRRKFAQTPIASSATPEKRAKSEQKPGTVRSLKPHAPIILPQTVTVTETARCMAGNRTDAILVVDSMVSLQLVGIVTDKDLAFRCVAEGLDPHSTLLSVVMTKNPVRVQSDTAIEEAINIMLQGHFRHLPIVDGQTIFGILDITKLIQPITAKITASWGRAKTLKKAYRDFLESWANFRGCVEVERWFADWEEKMVEPDLAAVLSPMSNVTTVGFKTSVRDAVRAMRDAKTTAVLVVDSSVNQSPNLSSNASPSTKPKNDLAGIFTTKDLCLRVLASTTELDPKGVSVVRVMTPRPDFGYHTWSLQDALKKMHNGHYLHLPVLCSATGKIMGLVDILMLTYTIFDLIIAHQSIQTSFSASAQSVIGETSVLNEEALSAAANATKGQDLWTKFFNDAEDVGLAGSGDHSFLEDELLFENASYKTGAKTVTQYAGSDVVSEKMETVASTKVDVSPITSFAAKTDLVTMGGIAAGAVVLGVVLGKLLK